MSITSRDVEHLQNQIDIINQSMTELYDLYGKQIIFDDYIVVPAARWEPDTTYEAYGFKAFIHVPGIDGTYFTMVEFEDEDVDDFIFAPVSSSDNDTVYIYCKVKPTRSVIVPLVVCYKGTRVDAY